MKKNMINTRSQILILKHLVLFYSFMLHQTNLLSEFIPSVSNMVLLHVVDCHVAKNFFGFTHNKINFLKIKAELCEIDCNFHICQHVKSTISGVCPLLLDW